MNIIILGAGQVGSSVARNLASEANDITIVDQDPDVLQALQADLDIRTVVGFAASPRTLEEAGIRDAELLIAVTSSDETNMLACRIAKTLFHTATQIARVRSSDYLAYPTLFTPDAIPVDVVISPEQIVTRHLVGLVEYPASLEIHEFGHNRAALVGVRAREDGKLVGRPVSALADLVPNGKARVVALYRDDVPVPLTPDTRLASNDEVLFVATRNDLRAAASAFLDVERRERRLTIAGGGNIGQALARALERDMHVKVIEFNRARATMLAEALGRAVVLHGDATDKALLVNEDIDATDVFCALTNDDEDNIMAALQAKRLGARRVIALINRQSYVELMDENPAIDVVVSPQQVTMGAILPHVRRGDVVRAYSLRGGEAEALEAVVHGDRRSSKLVGRSIGDLRLPPGASVVAVMRANEVLMPEHAFVIENDDHLVLFVADRTQIAALERMLQVSWHFL